jgi:hypothetical protein
MPQYLKADALSRPGLGDAFFRNMLATVVPRLVEQGVLAGKTVRGKTHVLADDALARVLQLGIEPLVYGQQGWSFVAVEAPIDRVAEVLRQVVDVRDYRPRVKVHRNQMGSGTPPDDVRPLYLVKPRAADWTLLVVGVHWFTPEDYELAEAFARQASKRLRTRAVAAMDNDVSGSYAQEWINGAEGDAWTSDDDFEEFYVKFYQRGIAAPSCWMSVLGGAHAFMSKNPDAIERVDFVGINDSAKPRGGPKRETVAVTFDETMTGEDVLRHMAEALGVSTRKKKKKTEATMTTTNKKSAKTKTAPPTKQPKTRVNKRKSR